MPWPNPRFQITYCDANTPCADQSSDCDSNASTDVMTDKLTGLMWPRNGMLAGSSNYYNSKNWYQAVDYANNFTLCGFTDWGLPNVNELQSLINAESETDMWLGFNQGFTDVTRYYWSSTTDSLYTSLAHIVEMSNYPFSMEPCFIDKSRWCAMVVGCMGINVWPVRSGLPGVIELPKTGQKISYRAGDDGDLERGAAWPVPRFMDNQSQTVSQGLCG